MFRTHFRQEVQVLIVQKRRGFTLIELLVVVVIIGILASIGVAGYGAAMDRARNGGVVSNVRTILVGIEQWKTDHPSLPATLIGANDGVAVACDTASNLGNFQVKYVPGGFLPKAPWSRVPQSASSSDAAFKGGLFDGGGATPQTALISEGSPFNMTKEGYMDDSYQGAGSPAAGEIGPNERGNFGHVYYWGNASASRYAVFGVGKIKKDARVIAVRTNYN